MPVYKISIKSLSIIFKLVLNDSGYLKKLNGNKNLPAIAGRLTGNNGVMLFLIEMGVENFLVRRPKKAAYEIKWK